MIRPKRNDEPIQLTKQDLMKLLTEDDAMKHMLQKLLQEVLEAEMETALQAGKSERTGGRLGYRSGIAQERYKIPRKEFSPRMDV